MSNNIFSLKRFQLLFKQHLIHNGQFLLLATVAYIGITFIVLSIAQMGNDLHPHQLEAFQGFLIAFVTIFGLLYVGHAFPALRSKESTIHYLMIPASTLEKFVFEFINSIVIALIILPTLFWIVFNVQGFFFQIFTEDTFEPIGFIHLIKIDVDGEYKGLIYALVTGGIFLAISLAFTGAAMFTKQPLIKSLFAVALVMLFFSGYSYIVIDKLGVGHYNPNDEMVLLPLREDNVLRLVSAAFYIGTAVMLFVAFRKLKEREV